MTSRLVFLIGPSGSGKTVVAECMAAKLGCPIFDTDSMAAAHAKRPIYEIFEDLGEPYFRQLETQIIDDVINGGTQGFCIVATGGGLPAIDGMMKRLLGAGTCVYLAASLDELWNRLTVDPKDLESRPLLRRSGRAGLERIMRGRESIYRAATIMMHTDGLDVDEVVDALIRELEKCGPETVP